jgi:2-iminobutanoate/2-iminopropanoate deaminase
MTSVLHQPATFLGAIYMSIERYPSALPVPLSGAVRAGGFVFLSGAVAVDGNTKIVEGGIRPQTNVALEHVVRTLKDCGLDKSDVVRATVWLADLSDFAAFNEEWEKFFSGSLPARTTVQSGLNWGALIEIEVQAWAG